MLLLGFQAYCSPSGSGANTALEMHTDVLALPDDADLCAFRMIISYSACHCTADDVATLGVTKTHVSAFGGIKNPRADKVTQRENGEFTRGFRAAQEYLQRSVEAVSSVW